jgi:HEAT repeat protein
MYWSCPRCYEKSTDDVDTCAACGTARGDEAPAPPLVPPPKKLCPKCRTEVQGPPVMARFTCRSCRHEFDDYEDWVRRCRAAAYAAAGPKRDGIDGSPGPEPRLLRPVALALIAGAPLNGLAAFWTGSDALLGAGLAVGALGATAGALLLAKGRGADRAARVAASMSALLPFLIATAPLFAWIAWHLTGRAWLRHYRTRPEPAPRTARIAVLGVLLGVLLVGGAALALTAPRAVSLGRAWDDPLPAPLAGLAWFFGPQGFWTLPALLALPWVLWAASRTNRPAFLAAGNAASVLLALGAGAATASAVAYSRGGAEAEATFGERNVAALHWKLKEVDPRLRIAAARALRETASPSVTVPALGPALGDADRRVRVEAAITLARLASSAEAAAVLAEGISSGRLVPGVEQDALAALALLGPQARPALGLLLERLGRSGAALDALVEMGAPAIPGLTAALRHADPAVRRSAAEGLRRLGPAARASSDALSRALADGDASVRSAAAAALADVLKEKSIGPLCELLEGDATSAAPAGAALCSLGERGGLYAVKEGGSFLNALRRPGIWDHLSRAPVDFDLEGSTGQVLEQIAVSAVMCIEAGPGAPPLSGFRRIHGSSRKRSALDVLRSTGLEFVLEEDRIRILGPAEAKAFWADWIAEQRR